MLSVSPTPLPQRPMALGGRNAATLFAHARAAIGHDVETARACLYQLEALLADAGLAAPIQEPPAPTQSGPVRGGLQPW